MNEKNINISSAEDRDDKGIKNSIRNTIDTIKKLFEKKLFEKQQKQYLR